MISWFPSSITKRCPKRLYPEIFGQGSPDHEHLPTLSIFGFPKIDKNKSLFSIDVALLNILKYL